MQFLLKHHITLQNVFYIKISNEDVGQFTNTLLLVLILEWLSMRQET